MAVVEFIPSGRNGRKALYLGFLYNIDKSKNDHTYWRCEKFNEFGCKARLALNGNTVLSGGLVNDHNGHAVEPERPHLLSAVARAKQLAVTNFAANPSVIHAQMLNEVATAAIVVPGAGQAIVRCRPEHSIKRTVARERRKQTAAPRVPLTVDELIIPQQVRDYTSLDGSLQDCIVYDSTADPDLLQAGPRLIIIATRNGLNLLATNGNLQADGTFKVCPPPFQQLYTLHVVIGQTTHPVIYALLPGKTGAIYTRLLRAVIQLCPNLDPRSLLTDMEQAFIGSFRTLFPRCLLSPCFFHLCQAVYRKVVNLGFAERYRNDLQFALLCRSLPALAFVPVRLVTDYFDRLFNVMPAELAELVAYFEATYIGIAQRNGPGRADPLFAVEYWNMYERTITQQARTNNAVEAFHRAMQVLLRVDHPSIWRFLDETKKMLRRDEAKYESLVAGNVLPAQRLKYQRRIRNVLNIVRDFDNRVWNDYLRGIAHALKFTE